MDEDTKDIIRSARDKMLKMTNAADGGPAYPFTVSVDKMAWMGISARDWFAGQALIGILSGKYPVAVAQEYKASDIAEDAYKMADAMLAHRKENT